MKLIAATIMLLFTLVSNSARAQTAAPSGISQSEPAPNSKTIKITRTDLLQSKKGSADYFTGSVQVQELFPANDPSRTSGGKVTFEPGARSAWHTHPLGQILIVTDGTGWIQQWGGPIEEIRKGDVVWISGRSERVARRNAKHRNDAHCNTGTTLNGKAVEWMEQVTDQQYHK